MNEEIKKESKLSLKWLYLPWLGAIFVCLVIGMIGAAVQGDPEPVIQKLGLGIDVFSLSIYGIGMVITIAILYSLLKKSQLSWDAVGLKGKLSSRAICYALGCVLIALLLYPLIEISLKPIGVSMYWGGESSAALLTSPVAVVLVLISAVLIAPITEEIIHRGYVLTMFLERGFKPMVAILLSVLIFTSIHIFFGLGIMVYIFFWAFIPTFLYLKFKSLYPAILFHFTNNLIAYIILPLLSSI
ncbi:MAG: type II CAAX endopeptidase family protein [Candidatus Thermoplasmatota archaeon]